MISKQVGEKEILDQLRMRWEQGKQVGPTLIAQMVQMPNLRIGKLLRELFVFQQFLKRPTVYRYKRVAWEQKGDTDYSLPHWEALWQLERWLRTTPFWPACNKREG